jgi:hypothetical protein
MYYMTVDSSAPRCRDGDYSPQPCITLACYFDEGCATVHFKVVYCFMDWRYGTKFFSIRLCVRRRSTFSMGMCVVLLAKLCFIVYLGRC